MNNWTRQEGYPLITVHKDKTISQKRFILLGGEDKSVWNIPIKIRWIDENNNETVSYITLKEKKAPLDLKSDLFKLNADSVGFYRVYYEDEKII